jgi:hypothetical protein
MIDDLSTVDVLHLANFADRFPHHLFEIHRRVAPVRLRSGGTNRNRHTGLRHLPLRMPPSR